MKKIFYIAAGNPVNPRVGMDFVVEQHLKELGGASDLDVRAVVVAPGIDGQCEPGLCGKFGFPVDVFVGDLLKAKGGLARDKLKFISKRVTPVMAYSFKCERAGERIAALLEQEHADVVIIDHFYAMANIDMAHLKKWRGKLIYISHDAVGHHFLELAGMKRGAAAKTYYALEAFRGGLNERRLFSMAAKVIHLSEYERRQIRLKAHKHVSLLPPIASVAAAQECADSPYRHTVLFVGSPNHPPNAHAIQWIVDRLAPELARVAPHLQIALVGGGTDKLAIRAPNVRGFGFVSQQEMNLMLSSVLCAISPVVRGGGIKIKVLDAIAAGCPLMATAESLRGFEHFGIAAKIRPEHPEALAEEIGMMARSEEFQRECRSRMRSTWSEFMVQRDGLLASYVRAA